MTMSGKLQIHFCAAVIKLPVQFILCVHSQTAASSHIAAVNNVSDCGFTEVRS